MAAPSELLLFILMLNSLHHLRVHSRHISTLEQTVLLSLNQHWGNPFSQYYPPQWNSSSSPCDWPYVFCTDGTVTGLSLSKKDISGTIPSSICQLKHLAWIDLSGNHMSGTIPPSLGDCSSLQKLDLSWNALSGTIPGELFLVESLVSLSLNGNRLYGIIPKTIGNASSLERLDLSSNYLNGSIPDGVAYLNNLSQLDLSGNSFSGEIPTQLFSIPKLQSLSLGCNNLSGQLPSDIPSKTLTFLNLAHNRLTGSVLKSFGEITENSSRYLDLSDNQLSGEIADISVSLVSMTMLNLCDNKFSGTVPYEFVSEYFQGYCLDLSNLCSAEGTNETLPSCPSSLCSYDRFHGYQMCAGYEHNTYYIIVIIALGISAAGGVGFVILYYLARKCKNTRKSSPFVKEEETRKMISFRRLKFKTTDILSGLTEENLIGKGGSGKVYRVFINQTKTYVAVKSISTSEITDAEKEFQAEIQTLGNIRHYNVVKLLCYISSPDLKLLVYEYFENNSLDRWLHGGSSNKKLDWPRRMNIAIGAAQGLCYMHHHCPIPIVHRDIKSSNILLDSDFNAKIADFGLAKLLNESGDTQTASAVAGTFGYIAPEYAYTSKVNAKSDVYSFGVVLLELTTGRRAVTRGYDLNLGGWAHLQCRDASATFDALDVSIKEAAIYLDQIISVFRLGVVCTSASPSNRPSMKDCLYILQNCSNNTTTSSPC